MIYSTYLGGSATEGMAVDAAGHMFVSGHTGSGDFPVTASAFQTFFAGGGWDAFVSELNPAGNGASDLLYSTYLGGNSVDSPLARHGRRLWQCLRHRRHTTGFKSSLLIVSTTVQLSSRTSISQSPERARC